MNWVMQSNQSVWACEFDVILERIVPVLYTSSSQLVGQIQKWVTQMFSPGQECVPEKGGQTSDVWAGRRGLKLSFCQVVQFDSV